jgi:tRNA(Arg) A34 adenosine deaminase TadA/catechol 2,3-dioxygenase-like lactoylglutathione lyase family enzyme
MPADSTDAELLRRAVRLAVDNADAGQHPFGAVVARGGEVLGDGVNTVLRDHDPTAHAEVAAIRAACRSEGTLELGGAALLSSCEPCPMCHAVALLVGITRIVYAATKEDAARAGFDLPPAAARMQEVWRGSGTDAVEHAATPGADEPFARYAVGSAAGPARRPVHELRVAVTVDDYAQALGFYRDVLGLPVVEAWDEPGGSGAVLDAGRATLELLSTDQAELVDRIEVGARVAGPVRLALEVDDSARMGRELVAGGAEAVAGPVVTPWAHRNVRVRAPDGMQLTLFTVLPGAGG